jgi:hypothetical protein
MVPHKDPSPPETKAKQSIPLLPMLQLCCTPPATRMRTPMTPLPKSLKSSDVLYIPITILSHHFHLPFPSQSTLSCGSGRLRAKDDEMTLFRSQKSAATLNHFSSSSKKFCCEIVGYHKVRTVNTTFVPFCLFEIPVVRLFEGCADFAVVGHAGRSWEDPSNLCFRRSRLRRDVHTGGLLLSAVSVCSVCSFTLSAQILADWQRLEHNAVHWYVLGVLLESPQVPLPNANIDHGGVAGAGTCYGSEHHRTHDCFPALLSALNRGLDNEVLGCVTDVGNWGG